MKKRPHSSSVQRTRKVAAWAAALVLGWGLAWSGAAWAADDGGLTGVAGHGAPESGTAGLGVSGSGAGAVQPTPGSTPPLAVQAPAAATTGAASLVRQVPSTLQTAWQSVAQGVADVPATLSVIEQGTASYLSNGLQGRRTASGERYNMNELTAAHKTLPLGTQVIVRSLETGREVVVRIIDRGPFLKNRIIDLSRAAAQALGIQSLGVSQVQVIEVPPKP